MGGAAIVLSIGRAMLETKLPALLCCAYPEYAGLEELFAVPDGPGAAASNDN